jgi:IS30 family transposase
MGYDLDARQQTSAIEKSDIWWRWKAGQSLHEIGRAFAVHRKLRNIVASKLILDWSPEQISGWLKTQYPDDKSVRVSHETIYRSLFIQARGVSKKELMNHLRSKRRMRRSRHATVSGQSCERNGRRAAT